MKIEYFTENQEKFLSLLELADEPRFIQKYLKECTILVASENDDIRAVMAITADEEDWIEIQNLAVLENVQDQKIGSHLLGNFLDNLEHYGKKYQGILVRTDEYTAKFYEKNGFERFKRVENYFPQKYGYPIYNKGRELKDNIYLRIKLK